MSSATADPLPSLESPIDALDGLLTAGATLGLLTYAGGLLLGDVGAATLGVALGVGCVIATLSLRSVRGVVRAAD
ncbi:hypothetical protein [Haloplanus salilacus]|uniref:hypothetical protein n=1 Tax=Haloplanus salilacus TaxID=2949994 RepID=UPI0030CBDA41